MPLTILRAAYSTSSATSAGDAGRSSDRRRGLAGVREVVTRAEDGEAASSSSALKVLVSVMSHANLCIFVLSLLLDLRCPPSSCLHHTFDLAVITRCAGCAAATRFERSATRAVVWFEGSLAR